MDFLKSTDVDAIHDEILRVKEYHRLLVEHWTRLIPLETEPKIPKPPSIESRITRSGSLAAVNQKRDVKSKAHAKEAALEAAKQRALHYRLPEIPEESKRLILAKLETLYSEPNPPTRRR
jgi:hypothetical protein